MKLVKTKMMKRYMIKFAVRFIIFLFVLSIYLFNKDLLLNLLNTPLRLGITPLHIIWLIFVIMMLAHLFPNKDSLTMALLKAEKEKYKTTENYDEL